MTASDRLLTIIRSLNEMRLCTIVDLHRETGIPRTAVYRAIETLCEHGYVQRVPNQNRYRLTSEIRQLSAGYREEGAIVEAATPAIEKLQRQFLWPTSFATIEKDRMVIRETTRYRSPFVFDTGNVGLSLPILQSAIGLAYIAFCSPESRRIVLELLRHSTDPLNAVALDTNATERALLLTARRGYGYRKGGVGVNTSSIACPVMGADGAVGALGMSFATSAVSHPKALSEFLPALREAAIEISTHAASFLTPEPRASD